jgi:small subunit ribosomal protein S17
VVTSTKNVQDSEPGAASPATGSEPATGAAPKQKLHKRRIIGVVTSDKMNKTRVVTVERRLAHRKYGKYMTSRTKYKAHDEKNEFKTGDKVQIVESRPLSRDKRWRVEKLIERPPEA